MPVSSLLLTITPEAEPALRDALGADPRTTLGDRVGCRLPIALDTPDREADRDAWDWLRALPGVRWIDLVWISIDPEDAEDFTTARRGHHSRDDGAQS